MMDENHNRGSPRLRFSKEELADEGMARPIAKAEKAADKYEAARAKLKKKHRLKLQKVDEVPAVSDSASEGKVLGISRDLQSSRERPESADVRTDPLAPGVQNTRRLPQKKAKGSSDGYGNDNINRKNPTTATGNTFNHDAPSPSAIESDVPVPKKKKGVQLKFEETQAKPPSRLSHPVQKTIRTAGDQLHRQAVEAMQSKEDDNAAADAVLQADKVTNSALQMGEHAYHAHKLRPYKQAEKAERQLDKANLKALEAKQQRENPQFTSNPYSRWQQKRAIRKEYAAAKRGKGKYAEQTVKGAEQAVEKTKDAAAATVETVRKHPTVLLVLALGAMLLIVMGGLQSCTPLAQSVLESIVIGTYPAEEEDVRAAERAYLAKEKELKNEMDHYERYHPGYDEYHVDADEIWHDPYVLIAIISAYYDGQDWDIDSAYPVIEKYFALQYEVTETISTQTRYRTENGESVPYTYTICNVTLENKNLSHLPVVSMSHHTMGMYALYMATHGNMEGIFTGKYATPLKDPMLYDIPQETLDADPTFARLMEEANKYVGYPYVWGGSSPETSFDCSGFVSYVFTNSGVYNTGRLGAKGLRSLCRDVPADQVKPGDIVFFDGTMGEGVDGITHCGIYVGNNMMIHCGSPLGYANLNDSYWRQHFHSYGRIPY